MSVYSHRTVRTSTTKSRTPSSILKKASNLKKRLNESSNTPAKVRFTLPHSKKIRSILQDYVENHQIKEYEQLVVLIRDAELFDEDISSILKEATECISVMGENLRLFVEALLGINWNNKSESVVKQYQSFIGNLVSAHNYHAELVIEQTVSLFIPSTEGPQWENGLPGESDLNKINRVHKLLRKLVTIIPMCKDLLLQVVLKKFPYYKKSAHIHEYYLHNIFLMMEYLPSSRQTLLYIIFSKLIFIDTNAPKEEIAKLQSKQESMDIDDVFEMEICTESVEEIANTLDVCMDATFNYIIKECQIPESEKLDWKKTAALYQDMISIFDKLILPTHNIHHVHFVMFFMCTLKPVIIEAFIHYLWENVSNVKVAAVLRQTSVNYMVSFMARGNFVQISIIKGSLEQMARWIHNYISAQDDVKSVKLDVKVHSVFYTVCQALFYIISFMHNDLIKSKKNMLFLESLNLAKIVTCRLNPLRVCQPAVTQNFAAITRKYQLAYCYSVIEHNSRTSLPSIYMDEVGSTALSNNVLEAFYPFDPYLLKRSKDKIQPHYRDYKEIKIRKERKRISEGDSKNDGADVDDFLDHRDLTSTSSKECIFSYGSSPGFKFKS